MITGRTQLGVAGAPPVSGGYVRGTCALYTSASGTRPKDSVDFGVGTGERSGDFALSETVSLVGQETFRAPGTITLACGVGVSANRANFNQTNAKVTAIKVSSVRQTEVNR